VCNSNLHFKPNRRGESIYSTLVLKAILERVAKKEEKDIVKSIIEMKADEMVERLSRLNANRVPYDEKSCKPYIGIDMAAKGGSDIGIVTHNGRTFRIKSKEIDGIHHDILEEIFDSSYRLEISREQARHRLRDREKGH
jgi:hypothetical protein